MNRLLLDTSVYIALLRGTLDVTTLQLTNRSTMYLCSVALQELYAGATDTATRKYLHDLERTCTEHHRVLTPTAEEWKRCGTHLAQIGLKHGFEQIRRSRLVNDILIALCCERVDATLITANRKNFELIQTVVEIDLHFVE